MWSTLGLIRGRSPLKIKRNQRLDILADADREGFYNLEKV